MQNELSWFDRMITPKTKAYKSFVIEMEEMIDTSPEWWCQDGERRFTEKEEKFMKIYEYLNHQRLKQNHKQDYKYNVTVFYDDKAETILSFGKMQEVSRYFEDSNLSGNRSLLFKDLRNQSEISLNNDAEKCKFLSDLWAKELTKRTELSSGLTHTQIDERQAYHYRNYECEAKELGIEVTPFIEEYHESNKSTHQLDYEEHNLGFDDLFSEEDFKENVIPASNLPEGWNWIHYNDGSGYLQSPKGSSYYSYDLQCQEYISPIVNHGWTSMKDFFEPPKSLREFVSDAEEDLIMYKITNHLSPKLSEEEKKDLLYHKIEKESIVGKIKDKDIVSEIIKNLASLQQYDLRTQKVLKEYVLEQEIKRGWMHLYDAVSPYLDEKGWVLKQYVPVDPFNEPEL